MKKSPCFVSLMLAVTLHHVSSVEKFKLSSGYEIPAIGLDTFQIERGETEESIANALEIGYRHFDTTFVNDNSDLADSGPVFKKWLDKGGKREDLFITSELPSHANRPESVEKYMNHSLKYLGLDYVDMYLIQTPYGFKEGGNLTAAKINGTEIFESVDHVALWKKMEEQVTAGRAKSIGLSNFNETQIMNIYNNAEIKPSNLQVEIHPYLQQRQLRDFCKKNTIVISAYSPLGSPITREKMYKGTDKDLPPLTDLPEIKAIAEKYNKTAAQVLLRHTVQDGIVVIPKSSDKETQKADFDIFNFSLSEDDVEMINALDKGEKGRVFDFSRFHEGLDKHPQYPFPVLP